MRKTTILMMIAVTLGFSGCKSNSGDKAQLTANEWQLKEMTTTKGKTTLPQRVPTLVLTDTNTMYGFSGCNRFFGRYSTEGNTIKLEPGGSTMMACPDLQFEHEYIQTLAAMTSYSIENKELKLTDKDRKQTLVFVPKTEEKVIGVANDAHGCNGAAGYTWSEARKDCIRLFESGVRMNPANDPQATLSTFIVFSTDSTLAEVFIPNMENHPLLNRRELPKGGYAWNVEDDDTYNVRQVNGQWVIEQRGETLYTETPESVINVVFQGGDGKTKMLYQVEVTFYPAEELAVVTLDDQTYELPQQRMASGFMYKNDQVSLMGKGKEAELTFPDGKVLKLHEKK